VLWKLATNFHLNPRLTLRGAKPPLPHTLHHFVLNWVGAQFIFLILVFMTKGSKERVQKWIKMNAYTKILSCTGPHMKQAKTFV